MRQPRPGYVSPYFTRNAEDERKLHLEEAIFERADREIEQAEKMAEKKEQADDR